MRAGTGLSRTFFSLALVLCASTALAGNSGTLWSVEAAGGFGNVPTTKYVLPELTKDASGALFVHHMVEPLRSSAVVVRIDPVTRTPLWSASSALHQDYHHSDGYFDSVVTVGDGSTVLVADAITRFAMDGSLVWTRPKREATSFNQFRRGVALPGGDLLLMDISASPAQIVRIDMATGTTAEVMDLTAWSGSQCSSIQAISVAVDTAFFASACVPGGIMQVRTAPLRVAWYGPSHEDQPISITGMATDGADVFVAGVEADEDFVRLLSHSDGTIAWETQNQMVSRLEIDPQGDLVGYGNEHALVECAHRITRFSASTGEPRWSSTGRGFVNDIAFSAASIVAVGDEHCAATPEANIGFATSVRLQDGVLESRSQIASPQAGWMSVSSVAAIGTRIFAVGASCEPKTFEEACFAALWHAESPAAPLQASELQVEAATIGTVVLESELATWLVALQWTSGGQAVRLQKVRNTDGAILADHLQPAPLLQSPWLAATQVQAIVTGDGDIAVLYGGSVNYYAYADATLIVLNATTGATRWRLGLLDPSVGQLSVAAYMSDGTGGDVFLGTLEEFYIPNTPRTRSLRKLDAMTGAEIWRLDFDPLEGFIGVGPPGGTRVAEDVLIYEQPIGSAVYGWTRRRGSDGSVVWNNPALPIAVVREIDSGSAIMLKYGTIPGLLRIDLVTGELVWSTSYSEPGDISFSPAGLVSGSDNEVYLGGMSRIASTGSPQYRGILMRIDKSTGTIAWVNRVADNPAGVRARLNPRGVYGGAVHSTQPMSWSDLSYGYVLTSASLSDGSLLGTQYLYGTQGLPQFPDRGDSGIYTMLENGQPIIAGAWRNLGRPYRFTLSSFDPPTLHEGGALRVALDMQRANGEAASTHMFTFNVVNEGSVEATNVHAILTVPLDARAAGVACSVGGQPCTARISAGSIDVTVDIAAGVTARLDGTLILTPATSPANVFQATAFAPYGFVELDMKDNVVPVRYNDVILRDGFD